MPCAKLQNDDNNRFLFTKASDEAKEFCDTSSRNMEARLLVLESRLAQLSACRGFPNYGNAKDPALTHILNTLLFIDHVLTNQFLIGFGSTSLF